jgi:two-component system, chemotaxis family, protein-glutamate methylesterase/glutaminase
VIKVLVVDDSALVRKLFVGVLESESDFEVRVARNGIEALAELQVFKPDVVTLDVHMPQMGGLECLDRIILERPCPVVMVSALTAAGADATLEALRLGAVDFIAKPEGAVSLRIDEFGPKLVEKIRGAASAKFKASRRLKERVQYRTGGRRPSAVAADGPAVKPKRAANAKAVSAASGDGLVVVGTSTGGPPALEALLTPLPVGLRWPIVIAQHMPASFTGQLAKRLDNLCAIRVMEVRGPILLEPGCAYIGRGDADIIITRRAGGLAAMSAPARKDYPWHPSTDRLVRSAMEHVPPEQLIGILMTGMGNDGADAMAKLQAAGGRTIGESEETAVVWGMPGELVKAGGADWVLPLHKIAGHLMQMVPEHAAHS